MATINDNLKTTLENLGFDGTIDDSYHSYLMEAMGYPTANQINDLRKGFFSSWGYSGAVQDMERLYLIDEGFSGTNNDMWHEIWGVGLA